MWIGLSVTSKAKQLLIDIIWNAYGILFQQAIKVKCLKLIVHAELGKGKSQGDKFELSFEVSIINFDT